MTKLLVWLSFAGVALGFQVGVAGSPPPPLVDDRWVDAVLWPVSLGHELGRLRRENTK